MADAITILLDVSKLTGALYSDANRTPLTLSAVYQGAELPMRIYIVSDTGSALSPPFVEYLSLDNLDLQVVVGPAAGSESILAAQYTWTKVTPPGGGPAYFSGVLDLNTTALNTAIGTASSYTTQLEFLLARSGAGFSGRYVAVHQTNLTVLPVVKGPSGEATIPTPAPSYLTAAQCFDLFAMWDNRLRPENAGRTLILVSPDGTHTRELGISDEGLPMDIFT